MQIISTAQGRARCKGMGIERDVDTLLTGDQPPGTWVLVFINSAREVLSERRAIEIEQAITALDKVMSLEAGASGMDGANNTAAGLGEIMDSLFSDLANREPPKPPSLLALEQQSHQHKCQGKPKGRS